MLLPLHQDRDGEGLGINLHLEVQGKEWLREEKESPRNYCVVQDRFSGEGISLEIFLQMKGNGAG